MRAAGLALLGFVGVGAGAACTKEPQKPVCGLHSAAGPVVLKGKKDRTLSVGAVLMPSDEVTAKGDALVECFGGALQLLEKGDTVEVGELLAARVVATTIPRYVLKDGAPEKRESLPPAIRIRYSDSRFTPESALQSNQPSTSDYFTAFFTPNGIQNLGGGGPRAEGPSKLAPPPNRPTVARIHAGELGQGGPLLTVEDETVFAQTEGLATAALPEGQTYDLGQASRLVLPDGAEATLKLDGQEVDLDGPMDLKLR